MANVMTLAPVHQAWSGVKKINGDKIGEGSHGGYNVEIYRAGTGRITIRCHYWHSEQDISREGFLLDHRVSGCDLPTAELRARDSGYPLPALMAAISEAEEAFLDA
jgi:hypothetical protein